jgi:hypothetical protein
MHLLVNYAHNGLAVEPHVYALASHRSAKVRGACDSLIPTILVQQSLHGSEIELWRAFNAYSIRLNRQNGLNENKAWNAPII